MLVVMPGTLCGTGFTGIRANHAEPGRLVTAQTHQLCSGIAQGSTFHIQLYTARHHFNILFLRTGRGAMITDSGAFKACFDTVLILMIIVHDSLVLHNRINISSGIFKG